MMDGSLLSRRFMQSILESGVLPLWMHLQSDGFYLFPFAWPVVMNRRCRIGSVHEPTQHFLFAQFAKSDPAQVKAHKTMPETRQFIFRSIARYVLHFVVNIRQRRGGVGDHVSGTEKVLIAGLVEVLQRGRGISVDHVLA